MFSVQTVVEHSRELGRKVLAMEEIEERKVQRPAMVDMRS